jgi:peptide/nickel transport system ATP-binding protein
VTFTIARGEAFGLVGESGCGKSTVAYQLLGYRRENGRLLDGHIFFQGTDIGKLDRPSLDRLRGNRMSLVPQNPTTALSPGMRIGKQLSEVLEYHQVFLGRKDERVVELLRLVGLPNPETIGLRYPHELSGGQQQRVCIAMALACEPDLLVLDEPTTGLDVTTQEQIVALLSELRARLGMAMLYVTHDLGVLAQIADRVGVMYAGRMVEVAPTQELFAEPKHPYTQGLIASIPRVEAVNRSSSPALRGLLRRSELPPGCPFEPRCSFAAARCKTERQGLEPVGVAHVVACCLWRSIPRPAPSAGGVQQEMQVRTAEPVLEVSGVHIGYGQGRSFTRLLNRALPDVVHDLSFRVGAREIFALVGESGSGKSTVARAVSGLIAPLKGSIRFEGNFLPPLVSQRTAEVRRRIQYIFQNPDASLNPRARIGRILARPIEMFFRPGSAITRQKVAEALEDVRLDQGYWARYPDQLSGGERQRVAIARALVANSRLLLCDEILSGLDVSVQANILVLLRRLRREHDLSMLFISHDLAVVRNLADRVGVLFRGRFMEVGDVEDIFAPPFHPYTFELLKAVPSIERPFGARTPLSRPAGGRGTGCAFAGRCAWQMGSICETEAPPWRDVTSTHRILCHLSISELIGRAQSDLSHLARKDQKLPA